MLTGGVLSALCVQNRGPFFPCMTHPSKTFLIFMRTRRARFRWRIPLQPPKWHGAHHVVHRRIRRRRHLRCGMFDIVLGPFLTHFSRISQQAQGACHPPRVVWRALLGAPADWTLIGACNPMLCPTYGGHLGLGNANVDGFYLDDNWGRPAPSEEAFPCKDGILDTIFSDQLARIFAILTYFSAMPPHTLRATCSTWSQWALPAGWCLIAIGCHARFTSSLSPPWVVAMGGC